MSKRVISKSDEYGIAVCDAILGLFRDEESDGNAVYHYDLESIDATAFVTGMIKGCNFVFKKLIQQDKNHLEFTYLANQLMVQELIEGAKNGNDVVESEEEE